VNSTHQKGTERTPLPKQKKNSTAFTEGWWARVSTHTGVEALDDGGGVAEEAAAERAREARRERRPLQPHHVPDSSAPSRPRRGRGGCRLASEDGAVHAAGRKSPSTSGVGTASGLLPSRLSPTTRWPTASVSSARNQDSYYNNGRFTPGLF